MRHRASPSGITLDEHDAAIIKGMLKRGDRQHDIAAWFGVNGGRVAEIATGHRFRHVEPAPGGELPPPGPYPSGRETAAVMQALEQAKAALVQAEAFIKRQA
jgi:hypothetical protein